MKKSFVETKRFIILLHILIWSTFFILQILAFQSSINNRPVWMEKPNLDISIVYYRFVFQIVVMISLYYLNSLIFIPKLLFKKKIIAYILVLIICLFSIQILDVLYNDFIELKRVFRKPRPLSIYIATFILAVSLSVKLIQKWFFDETQKKAMNHEKIKSELSLLKSQVNPHFLFNTLNGIYSLANSKSDKTAPAIVKLSQLMRYMLDESKQQFVPLTSELDYINTFIDLQRLRLFDNVKIEFNINGDTKNIKIQPLLLIPFIENAFKHGTDSRTDCLIDIVIEIKEDSIHLTVKNDNLKSGKEDAKSGFGFINIKRRLDLEYPQKYVLNTEITENKFIVKLVISFK